MKRGILLIVLVVFLSILAYGLTFLDSNQGNFNNGTYVNTTHNGSAVILIGENLSGEFTGRIFDASGPASWKFINASFNLSSADEIYAVDNQADVWKSTDSGVTWTLVKDDYNSVDSNDVTDIFYINNKTLYIVVTQKVWVSGDFGLTWTKINDDYNGAEGQNSFVAIADKNDLIYIIEGDQDVWRSNDFGATWTKASTDFNGENGNIFGITVNNSNTLFVVDNQADIWKSENNGTSWTLIKDDYHAGAGNNADGMAIDKSNNIYILDLQDVWSSNDSGVTWTKVNDGFNGAGDSNNGQSISIDNRNNIYVVDGSEDVFQSNDSGITFVKIATDFNGENGLTPAMTIIQRSSNITFQVKNCSLSDCSDANFLGYDLTGNTYFTNLSNSLNRNGRYFQYKAYFSRETSSALPQLFNASISYESLGPVVNITKPENNQAFNINMSLPLNFTITNATSLSSCWYNLNNGNNITLANCQNTTFNASDGSHSLNLFVNDSSGNIASTNVNFSISATGVSLSLSQPNGTKTSRDNIPIQYNVVGNNLTCWYNVLFSTGASVRGNTSLSNCENSNFSVSVDGSYIFNLYVNNTQGILNSSTLNFSVSITSSSGGSSSGGGGSSSGSGGSSGGGSIIGNTGLYNLQIQEIDKIFLNPSETKILSLNVKNSGARFLNKCRLISNNEFSSWINSKAIEDIGPGQNKEFIFDLIIPNVEKGEYSIELILKCNEKNSSTNLFVEVIDQKLILSIIDVKSEDDQILVSYTIRETSGVNQNVSLTLSFVDNEEIAESFNQLVNLNPGEEKNGIFEINSRNLQGEFNLVLRGQSEITSTTVERNIVLGNLRGVGGLAILNPENRKNLLIGLIITVFIVLAFFIVRGYKRRKAVKIHWHGWGKQ